MGKTDLFITNPTIEWIPRGLTVELSGAPSDQKGIGTGNTHIDQYTPFCLASAPTICYVANTN